MCRVRALVPLSCMQINARAILELNFILKKLQEIIDFHFNSLAPLPFYIYKTISNDFDSEYYIMPVKLHVYNSENKISMIFIF